MTNTTLFKCFIPIDTSTDYTPNIGSDIFAVNELDALELVMNENISPAKLLPYSLSEIPKHIQKRLERADRTHTHIQSTLKNGNINEIQKIKLIFAEIKIHQEDIKSITENQNNEKYLRISLQGIKFSMITHEKHIKELDHEFNADTEQVTIKRLIFTK